ncbi:HCLS1-associated protein X-1-like isoform X2 [Anthonomus grandis grandis]|uniref:HCLS1-associated protein X-1-like isoform X2 n=1 Tax=Anthonomus grandis grandis TaxID=2921223 RepID=UPI0021656FFC|nr:HCLS1-associated protein X-1-like isoform X2 [Anthonomus grandis grandis]
MDIFRKIFGLPEHKSYADDQDRMKTKQPTEPPETRTFSHFPNDNNFESFNVFTDPVEMHRYFEQQMESIFKSFGMPSFGNFFRALEQPSMDEEFHDNEEPNNDMLDSRDYYLKRGYDKPSYEHPAYSEKVDKDVDGKLSISDIDRFFDNSNNQQSLVQLPTRKNASVFGNSFFNQSVQMKTIRNPDGSIEAHRIVTDSEGNQETTITKKLGEKEYTVLRKRDKEGKEEEHETLINMTEEEKGIFDRTSNTGTAMPYTPLIDESMFSRFFK